ncbi:uncharacterized protein [Cicer arietinum]|uniref:uncharacterized protein n=1 Tax=Cicer arietinum TaxID=3827 RepID=UPI003CC68C16
MQAYLEAQGDNIWDAVENGPHIPKTVINNKEEIKIKNSWTDEDKRKVLFDKKAKNILQSALGIDEFLRISHFKTAKEIWDTLEVTHEGTIEVKRSKLKTLSQEYELFRMQPGESILDLQKRFTPTCSYCGLKGHTPNTCHIRNISIPKGHMWIEKDTNHQGPKTHWVHPNKI